MDKPKYYSIKGLIDKIDEKNRDQCEHLLVDNWRLFSKAKGSKTKHQTWEG